MDLGKHVLDKEILDRAGRRAGKVDDLLLDLPPAGDGGLLPQPEVVAIISGPMALARQLPPPLPWLARQLYRLLGLADPRPIVIPWQRITHIDVVVYTDLDRETAGFQALPQAVNRRFIRRLPGA